MSEATKKPPLRAAWSLLSDSQRYSFSVKSCAVKIGRSERVATGSWGISDLLQDWLGVPEKVTPRTSSPPSMSHCGPRARCSGLRTDICRRLYTARRMGRGGSKERSQKVGLKCVPTTYLGGHIPRIRRGNPDEDHISALSWKTKPDPIVQRRNYRLSSV